MTCPHLPGSARLLLGRWAARLALGVAALAALPGPAAAAPSAPRAATPATKAASAPKANHPKPKSSKSSKAKKGTSRGAAKKRTTRRGKAAAAAATATGTAAATAAPPEERDPNDSSVRLPLMLRVTPALPDNLAALRSRLDSVLTAQGAAAQGATVDNVSQLGPDIYAFALRCIDAEQCQRLRLTIESERDWVAGLQLDERRHIPRAPERDSPAAR